MIIKELEINYPSAIYPENREIAEKINEMVRVINKLNDRTYKIIKGQK